MHAVDWSIIAVYLVISLGIGILFSRRAGRSINDFFLSGRNLPWWIIGTSMVATTFAADTPLAVTEYVRTEGIWRNWFWWTVAFGHVLAAFAFSRLWRRAEVLTDNELIELRYSGKPAAVLRGYKAIYSGLITNLVVMAWVTAGMSAILREVLDIRPAYAIVLCLAIALLYSVLSGLWGVVVTDLLQFVVAMGGSIAFAWIAVRQAGGIPAVTAQVAAANPETLSFLPDLSGPNALKFLVFVGVMWWSSDRADGGGYIIQRMMSAKDERHALLGTFWFAVAHYALRVWPWVLVALVTLVSLPHLTEHMAAYPRHLMTILPVGLKGVFTSTFLAAFMSTIDTHLNWGSSYLVNDLYKRFWRPQASARRLVLMSRLFSVVLAVLAGVIATFVTSISAAWEFLWALGAGIGLVLIARWFWWRVNAWSEISALTTSLVMAIGLKVRDLLVGPEGALEVHVKALILVPTAIVVWVATTLLTRPEPAEHLATFYRRVRPPGRWGPITRLAGDVDPSGIGWGLLVDWVAGVAVIYGLTFGLGRLVLGPMNQAWWLLGAAVLGLAVIVGRRKLFRPSAQNPVACRARSSRL